MEKGMFEVGESYSYEEFCKVYEGLEENEKGNRYFKSYLVKSYKYPSSFVFFDLSENYRYSLCRNEHLIRTKGGLAVLPTEFKVKTEQDYIKQVDTSFGVISHKDFTDLFKSKTDNDVMYFMECKVEFINSKNFYFKDLKEILYDNEHILIRNSEDFSIIDNETLQKLGYIPE